MSDTHDRMSEVERLRGIEGAAKELLRTVDGYEVVGDGATYTVDYHAATALLHAIQGMPEGEAVSKSE